ncbi:MAG TPA: glycosyltransferase family 4 protein [Thermoanaerobaculia bacterium]|nr:glycosyltransferase family 4 protein [Thermoanaerobaculia bacterium]
MAKPLLLSILPRPPHPTRDGLAIRNYHLLAGLAEIFRVRALALKAPHLPSGEYPAGVEAEEFDQSPRRLRRGWAAAASLVSGRAYPPLLYRSGELVRAARAGERPAWTVAHAYHVGPLALKAEGRRWIDFHNLESQIWERVSRSSPAATARWFAGLQEPRIRALEARLASSFDGLSCVSEPDAEALSRWSSQLQPLVVPNGVDLARYRFRETPAGSKTVLFVGDLSWPPNADAVRWFRSEAWPAIRREHPDARAEILGREPPADLLAQSSEDFRLLGEGGDTRPHWEGAAVAVAPLQAAGGTRLKILEAAACGVPVVATGIGAEGLKLEPGRDILLADGPEAFARAVSDLIGDPSRRAAVARSARSRVEALYSWPSIARRLADELFRRLS